MRLNFFTRKRRLISFVFLGILIPNILLPVRALALTSGPAQPESQSFQPAGVADMVDLQSGDLKYNIPLLDIDGYPLNLSYHSGSGMDDEASWVGLGWSLNTGAINRQVRGVPDDMAGDLVETDHYVKPMTTVGGRLASKTETFGLSIFSLGGSISAGVYLNNYTGFGVELTGNAGISHSRTTSGTMTSSLGAGITSDSQKGVDVSISASLPLYEQSTKKGLVQEGLTGSLGYNTRNGMKSLSLGESFGLKTLGNTSFGNAGVNFSYNTEPTNPDIGIPYTNFSYSYTISGGVDIFGQFGGLGLTGYTSKRSVANPAVLSPTFGFLYAQQGKNRPDAVMDFIRENENPVIPELPRIALPIQTPDMFSYTSQMGSGQFRLYRGGTGEYFDNKVDDDGHSNTGGVDLGGSFSALHLGVNDFDQDTRQTTQKWRNDNAYGPKGDFQDPSIDGNAKDHVFFKEFGEMNKQDISLANQIGNTSPVMVQLNSQTGAAFNQFSGRTSLSDNIEKKSLQPRKTMISYLTAEEATSTGLDVAIKNYKMIDAGAIPALLPASPEVYKIYPRVDPADRTSNPNDYPALQDYNTDPDMFPARKSHHISEITVTDNGGKRMVYGLPVYNLKQNEYSFALGADNIPFQGTNRVAFPGRNKGNDYYYHKETKPPYATSYLLTAILSPDYADKTGNGITDDDQGTAIKFNYSRVNKAYTWRAPFEGANLNRGLLGDKEDDKGSIIYGKKELWYISSIESKTKVVYFITEDRKDGLGAVNEWSTGGKDNDQKQRRLTEVRLYSKADMSRPIKVVKFKYSYKLCNNVPNFNPSGAIPGESGKLTLDQVWFEYRNIQRGQQNRYDFTYNTGASYGDMLTDRWGMYKAQTENNRNGLQGLTNEEFPYANQSSDRSAVNTNAAMWQLSKIGLPTGGEINVAYEADDYAYVQNRKAMAMYPLDGLFGGPGNTTLSISDPQYLYKAKGIVINLPHAKMPPEGEANVTAWFKKNMLGGADYLYTKTSVDFKTKNFNEGPDAYDFVPCFTKVTSVERGTGDFLKVFIEGYNENGIQTNTIMQTAMQRLKNEYPKYAFPGYSNKSKADVISGILSVLGAVVNAASNFGELFNNFYQTASSNRYLNRVNLGKSFIRLNKYDGTGSDATEVISKVGGGSRVKSVYINDNWQPDEKTSGNQDKNALLPSKYGQSYTYTTTDNGKTISSGVASYEPGIGNDENPFKMPVPYVQQVKGGISNYLDVEEPFGESVFPAAGVTYSKVTVRDLGSKGIDALPSAAAYYTVNEFYTSKDFPVRTNFVAQDPVRNKSHSLFSPIQTWSHDELTLSQGYSVELNDMNGKPRAVRVFDQVGAQISATEYFYKSSLTGDGSYKLDNNVKVISEDGSVASTVLGQDIELFTDMREQEMVNSGRAINYGSETLFLYVFAVTIPHLPFKFNEDYRRFRSACAFKVVQSYGILDRVVKTQNGSSVTTENIAFDGVTGEAIVTRTQNEFNKDIFTTTIPAYWAYKGMSGAYKSNGILLSGMTSSSTGEISNYTGFLSPGDEFIDLRNETENASSVTLKFGTRYWVVPQTRPGLGTKTYLMTRYGEIIPNFQSSLVKVVRSGNRNMLDADITQVVSLNNPIGADNKLLINGASDITSALKVINASASTYDETWATEIPDIHPINVDVPYNLSVYTGTYPISVPPYRNSTLWQSNSPVLQNSQSGTIGDNYSNPIYSGANTINNTMGMYTKIYVPHTGSYAICYFAQANLSFAFGAVCLGTPWYVSNASNGSIPTVNGVVGKRTYYISSVNLTEGYVYLNIELRAANNGNGASIQIYNNTTTQLENATPDNASQLDMIFSTQSLLSNPPNNTVYLKRYQDPVTYYKVRYNDYKLTPYSPCETPVYAINPYLFGYAGNWKSYKTKVFQQSRAYNTILNATPGLVNIKDAGYIKQFFTNWYYNGSGWVENPNTDRWTTANTVTLYDKFGQQLENRDALQRYSSAKFDFNGELPAAVSSNARNREIYANAFEDGYFTPGGTNYIDDSPLIEFANAEGGNPGIQSLITGSVSHSGNYSLALPAAGILLKTQVFSGNEQKTFPYFIYNTKNEFIKDPAAKYPKGFQPLPGTYLLNVWVKDDKPNDRTTPGVTVTNNGGAVGMTVKAVVEGWKLLEGQLSFTSLEGANLSLAIKKAGSTPVYIDDIRIHPKDSQMKTYAYDDKSMRLMAELDENCFATFYEYDSEGKLIRVKKETEKGVATIKESRSFYIKKN